MPRIRLICWNPDEARRKAEMLHAPGWEVITELPAGPELLRGLRESPPAVLVVDLDRLPSQGRDLGVTMRCTASTRGVPLVFAGGADAKVAAVRELLPDAVFVGWSEIQSGVAAALTDPPSEPVVPASVMAAYAGRPLDRKLGLRPGMTLALVDAPPDFRTTLAPLPAGVRVRDGQQGDEDLVIWFVRSREGLARNLEWVTLPRQGTFPVWIAWPKKASGIRSDLSQAVVRRTGLAAGLVDYKICAIDTTWSALLFSRRKDRGEAGRESVTAEV